MKNNIALPPFHIVETTRFTVEADHELTQALRRYQAYYQDAYGVAVSEADLLSEMGRQFMAEDRAFKNHGQKRRRPQSKPPAALRTAPGGGGKPDPRGPAAR